VTDGSGPGTALGRHARQHRGGWLGQRWRLMLLTACIAVVTVAVPPLVAPHHGQSQSTEGVPRPVVPGTTTAVAPTSPAANAVEPAASMSSPGHFIPISIQAEDPANLLSGGAAVVACGTCDGGYRVRYICTSCRLVVRTTLAVPGSRTVTVVYESNGSRAVKISFNGARPLIRTVSGPDWTTPQTLRFTAVLPAGTLLVAFYNDESPAPDIDKVVVS
jgi:hypothetical protein